MNIKIEKIISTPPSLLVAFSTNYGNAIGTWEGEMPILDSNYDVEIDIDNVLLWGKEIINGKKSFNVSMNSKNEIILNGILDSLDEDGYAVLRLGSSITAFMTNIEKVFPFEVGSYIELTVPNISLFPV